MRSSRVRLVFWIAFCVALGGGAGLAQVPRVPSEPGGARAGQLRPDFDRVLPPANAPETRQELQALLRKHPPSVAQVLRLDPSLLTQPTYLETYPELAIFLERHPEIGRDPVFFFGRDRDEGVFDNRARAMNMFQDLVTGGLVLLAFAAFLTFFASMMRSAMDYRRWLRLSKIQVEVHGKLMDRLSSNEDLLAYMQSSAGRRFLESAPIPLDASTRALTAPLSRILWSAQAGIVLALGGVGLRFVSRRVVEEVSQGFYVMGVVATAVGLGFILSAVMAYVLSRRLGLIEPVNVTSTAEVRGPSPPA